MFTMLMCLLIYLHAPYILRVLLIYYAHTIDSPSVLAPSPPTYLVGLTTTTTYMYIYGLFTLIQL